LLNRIVAGDADLLGGQLLGPAGIAPHAELGDPNRITLNLELLAGGVVLRMTTHVAGIAKAGRLIIVVVAWVRGGLMLEDAPALLAVVHLRAHVIGDRRPVL